MTLTQERLDKVDELKAKYNATVVSVVHLHSKLMRIRIQHDSGDVPHKAGQYATLGLGNWEARNDQQPTSFAQGLVEPKLIQRAYSISCPLLDDQGKPQPCHDYPEHEFYITLVDRDDDDSPPLTPRLFQLKAGDRLLMRPKMVGHYTLSHLTGNQQNVIFVATGTGEAPHLSMAAELLANGHQGNIVSLCTVRYFEDSGYFDVQKQATKLFSNYKYEVLTTREPVNLDPSLPGYVGKRYVQSLFAGDAFHLAFGWKPDPEHTHIFLCGNPQMIGKPEKNRETGDLTYPQPTGMIETLVERGFTLDQPRQPGNIHMESYW